MPGMCLACGCRLRWFCRLASQLSCSPAETKPTATCLAVDDELEAVEGLAEETAGRHVCGGHAAYAVPTM